MSFFEDDWVRYSEDFCERTSSTDMGLRDMLSRRGKVINVFDDGRLCNVDWGDIITQFPAGSPLLVKSECPYQQSLSADESSDSPSPGLR